MIDLEQIGICNSFLEVDLDAFAANAAKVRAHIGPNVKIMPVLKGNAYAAGLCEMARFLYSACGADIIACAQVWEARQMRDAGVSCDMLIMGGVPFNNIPAAVEMDLMTPAYNREYLILLDAEAARAGKTARVHIKVETGLNRIGTLPGPDMDTLITLLAGLKNIEAVGAFTHFAESEATDKSFTMLQMERFKAGVAQLKRAGLRLDYVHAFNTAAISWLKDPIVTHVRAAGIFFGYDTCLSPVNALDVKEVLAWRSFITEVKTVRAGDTVGYNRHFKAERDTRVATVSVGYGDGYARHLAMACGADMLVRGKRAPVIGFCMDQAFLDVTGLKAEINDIVTLLGGDGHEFISVFELQQKMGQTYLATVAPISGRVKRIYTHGESMGE